MKSRLALFKERGDAFTEVIAVHALFLQFAFEGYGICVAAGCTLSHDPLGEVDRDAYNPVSRCVEDGASAMHLGNDTVEDRALRAHASVIHANHLDITVEDFVVPVDHVGVCHEVAFWWRSEHLGLH